MSGQSESGDELRKLIEEVFELRREVAKLKRPKKAIEKTSLKGVLLSLILPAFFFASLIVLIYVGKDVGESKISSMRLLGVLSFIASLFVLFVLSVLVSLGILNEVNFSQLVKYSLRTMLSGFKSLLKRKQ